jgi:hypothetical protein
MAVRGMPFSVYAPFENVGHVLGRIFLLTAQGRLTTKRAAVLQHGFSR